MQGEATRIMLLVTQTLEQLGIPSEGALSPYLRERILNEMRVVYGER